MRSEPTLITSVQRALTLLDAVAGTGRPMTAKSLARRTGLALSTTYHLLRTLVHEGYLARVDGGYVLGDRLATLVEERGRMAARNARFRAILQAVHDQLHAAAYLSVLDDGEIRLLDVVDSPAAPRVDLWVGFHEAAHATALGKAVLSSLERSVRQDYVFSHDVPDLTPHTVTDRRVLLRQLEMVDGWGVDRGEYMVGVACVGAAVRGAGFVGAVAVSVASDRVSRVLARRDVLERAAVLTACATI